VIGIGRPPADDGDDRVLLTDLVADGQIVGREPLDAARDRHVRSRHELPPQATQLSRGEPAIPTVYEQEQP
jgi:nicotinate phosphoribosyltransferase